MNMRTFFFFTAYTEYKRGQRTRRNREIEDCAKAIPPVRVLRYAPHPGLTAAWARGRWGQEGGYCWNQAAKNWAGKALTQSNSMCSTGIGSSDSMKTLPR